MPLFDLFISMIWIFLFIAWIILVVRVFSDIFRSNDMGGVAKVIWMAFVILAPYLGVFAYVIIRGRSMSEREVRDARANEEAFRSYIQSAAGSSPSVADQLAKLVELRDAGSITADDYAAAKARVLS